MPVVETPTTSQPPLNSSRSSARCGGSRQQFGSNTFASTPADSSTPAKRQTPRGGARKVNSPQCGSYGPISNILGAPNLFTEQAPGVTSSPWNQDPVKDGEVGQRGCCAPEFLMIATDDTVPFPIARCEMTLLGVRDQSKFCAKPAASIP